MDDYYDLLGVNRDAAVDDIRAAYRRQKDSIAGMEGGTAKEDAARLNKAWNVLSDPYQRGRYDAQREAAGIGDDDRVGDSDGDDGPAVVADAAPARRRRLFDPPDRSTARNGAATKPVNAINPRALKPQTFPYPKGMTPAPQRKRLTAMVIDLSLMVLIFIGATLTATAVVEARYPEIVDREDAITAEIDDLRPIADDLDEKADAAEDQAEEVAADTNASATEKEEAQDAATEARAASDKADDEITALEDEFSDLESDLIGTRALVTGGFYVLGLLILAVPSALNGQTLGKRMQGLKVVRENGAPLGWIGAFRRYGLLVVATFLFGSLLPLGPLAAALVLLAVTRWMSNANLQGLHDRVVHTIVVEADRAPERAEDQAESSA